MMDILYLGLGIIVLISLNAIHIGWRGSQVRKQESARNKPFGGK